MCRYIAELVYTQEISHLSAYNTNFSVVVHIVFDDQRPPLLLLPPAEMDSTVEELVAFTLLTAGMVVLSVGVVLVCFFHRSKQVPSALMAVSDRTAVSPKEMECELICGEKDLTKTEVGTPCEGDPKVLFGCRSYSSPNSLVLLEVVSPLDLPLMPKKAQHLLPLLSTLPLSHVATMSPLSPMTSTPRLSPAGSDSYDDDDLPLFPQNENHF